MGTSFPIHLSPADQRQLHQKHMQQQHRGAPPCRIPTLLTAASVLVCFSFVIVWPVRASPAGVAIMAAEQGSAVDVEVTTTNGGPAIAAENVTTSRRRLATGKPSCLLTVSRVQIWTLGNT